MNLDNINKRNTREWVKVNEDSQAHRNREAVVAKHGGAFSYFGKREGWKWFTDIPKPTSFKLEEIKKEPKAKWIFIHPDGKEELVENLSKFCRKHELNKAAMYEVYHGKRNHHKNFKLKKQGD